MTITLLLVNGIGELYVSNCLLTNDVKYNDFWIKNMIKNYFKEKIW